MPIGDMFLSTIYRAWELQAKRQKEIMSPRSVLSALGRKYDQYLDFAQQDAHEFLRILLDAMRMEEHDIIKQRQPPPPPKKRRRSTLVPGPPPPPPPPPPIPEEETLISFVDMIFGGRLTSILVCQKCKHISQTYEDFNDISLSIKPEDYSFNRKRNRLKNLAKRLTGNLPAFAVPELVQRSSSVPPSPKERPEGQLIRHDDSPPPSTAVRRKSMEFHPTPEATPAVETNGTDGANRTNATEEDPHLLVNVTGPEGKHIEFVEVSSSKGDASDKEKEKKDKDSDSESNWAKLGRRLSLGLGKPKDKEKKSRAHHRVSAPIIEGVPLDLLDESAAPKPTLLHPHRASVPPGALESPAATINSQLTDSPRPSMDSSASISSIPSKVPRSKSPKPPKPTAAETEYLRRILADIDTSTSTSKGANHHPLPHPFSPHAMWLGGKTLSGIEECLRMFTAVEVLDGENMVGCRRCWKIANGMSVKSKSKGGVVDDDEDSDSAGGDEVIISEPPPPVQPEASSSGHPQRPGPLAHIQPPGVHIPTSISTPTVSFYGSRPEDEEEPLKDKSDTRSISSLPTRAMSNQYHTASSSASASTSGRDSPDGTGPGGLPIPVISTTAPPDSLADESSESAAPSIRESSPEPEPPQSLPNGIVAPRPVRPSNFNDSDSLLPPPRHVKRKGDVTTTDEEESSGDETDTSVGTSVSADSVAGAHTPSASGTTSTPQTQPKPQPKKPPKPKPVIMRPAYKRYLIATPPPVLVIHLKRFQQLNKNNPFTSFSYGFKKLDDYVTFPEYLDLAPFLAPKKEDYGLGSKKNRLKNKLKVGMGQKAEEERCMYRLYAVVVHIGNMLGGHYIAYTALPSVSPIEGEGLATKEYEEKLAAVASAATTPPTTANPSTGPAEGSGSKSSTNGSKPVDLQPTNSSPSISVEPPTPIPTAPLSLSSIASIPAPQPPPQPQTPPQSQSQPQQSNSTSSLPSTSTSTTKPPAIPATISQSHSQASSQSGKSSSSTTGSHSKQHETGKAKDASQPKERQWAYISDTIVRLTTLEEVLNAKAYICMYERC
ncbi:ubiquitin carboxyl-terminal hydrolase 4, variant 2 [Coprinopsis cinerea AmutBmut pab1-1]|nr:ubiquitin carboxyl-terminal hydrolase 4, variant 2 [Coprinopsis cinerea AmutBmut pab1-1]